jgi:glycosyltransferase involved in cell wall biosynthesis
MTISAADNMTLLSVVVPCYNEDAVILATHARLVSSMASVAGCRFEIVYVDDGSTDGTYARLNEIQLGDRRVRVVALSRNFGHQLATTAGIEHASGDVVVLIDADLQDPPEIIPEMVRAWRQGNEVVYGLRTRREGETRFKRWSAKLFYRVINRLSDVGIPFDAGDFRLMDRKVVDALLAMPERDRFLRGMVSWIGFRQIAVRYDRDRRLAGESKYPFWKMLRFGLDGIVSFSTVPLRLATWLGFGASALALLGIMYAVVMRLFTSIWVTGWTALIIAVLFMGGVQLVTLGILGEYVGRVYGEIKRRPLYVVRETLGFDAPTGQGPASN